MHTFDENSTRRIANVVRFIERKGGIPVEKRPPPLPATTKNGIAVTPTGGIPGRTGSGTSGDPWVWGSALCNPVNVSTGIKSSETITVYNCVESEIDGDEVIQWKLIGGKAFVDVEDC